jgi:hypothetical protein
MAEPVSQVFRRRSVRMGLAALGLFLVAEWLIFEPWFLVPLLLVLALMAVAGTLTGLSISNLGKEQRGRSAGVQSPPSGDSPPLA